ncbi:MAG: haloacid dehalogenase type II [Pseudomonadota bacterium]
MQGLSDYSALTFDCYGTLIDWESGIWDALQPIIRHNRRADITRDTALLEFAKKESAQEAATPGMVYPDVLRHVHQALADEFNLETTSDLDDTFGESVPFWPAFSDSADALRILKKHFKLVILSNVDRAGFAASNNRLGVEFDAIYTAEDAGSYKPNSNNFDFMLENIKSDLGVEPDQILHTAQSLFHDHVPATNAGLARAWIDRQRLSQGGSWGATAEVAKRPTVDFTFFSMMEMAEAVLRV